MASRIDNPNPITGAAGPPVSRPVNRAGNDQDAAPAAVPADDRLQLSGEAAGMLTAQREVGAAPPPMDQARIDSIRADIAAGKYTINPQEIASRLIALERKLAG